jgi:hypothetical protein
MPETPQSNPDAYALRMTTSDGSELYFYDEKYHAYAQTKQQKITLFSTKPKAKAVRAIQNRLNLELWDIVEIRLFADRIDIINL